MHETLALSAPNRQIHRRKGQTCTHVYRPDNGDPTHRLMATNFEFLFVRWIANPTEGHFPVGSLVVNANLSIHPRLNIFSKNCEKNVSKSEQFSSCPLFTPPTKIVEYRCEKDSATAK